MLRGPDPAHGIAGGKLLVTVPAFMFLWSRNDVINMHQRRYTAPELQSQAGTARLQGVADFLQQLLRLPDGCRRDPAAPRPGRAGAGVTAFR